MYFFAGQGEEATPAYCMPGQAAHRFGNDEGAPLVRRNGHAEKDAVLCIDISVSRHLLACAMDFAFTKLRSETKKNAGSSSLPAFKVSIGNPIERRREFGLGYFIATSCSRRVFRWFSCMLT